MTLLAPLRRGDRIEKITAAEHESVPGTERTSWAGLAMSVGWGEPEAVGGAPNLGF